MTLTVYNSLTRQKEIFKTLEANKVRMYCCGITVYDYCHLGHARTCLVWDVVRSYLEWLGYEVNYIQNFTDIDDKILNRARKEGTSMEDVSERFIKAYFEDMSRLGIREANDYPRATQSLDSIKKLVGDLEAKGFAYPADGDVYYSVRKFSDYGKLSGRKLEDMQTGASGRVDNPEIEKKKDPCDFALWKAAKEGEPCWDSAWGEGRPGWHIECSAMVRERLGETIDIHAGGSDLAFPHHENEIAQSEAANGQTLANYWLHNGMVKVDGEKMSKSLGNFTTIRELLDKPVEAMAMRLFILQAHYRKPVDFTDEAIASATNGWETLKEGLLFGDRFGQDLGFDGFITDTESRELIQQRFKDAVDDDFNFTAGLAILFEMAKELEKEGNIIVHQGKTTTETQKLETLWHTLVELSGILGFKAELTAETVSDGLTDEKIEQLIEQRATAKKVKNWAESDRIRDELKAEGISLIDTKEGTTWHRG
ncbi:MAG: cysteine--tRNA ligase [Cyanobacteria bacterium P01_F01_bin.143]